jgi:hypothetical protein
MREMPFVNYATEPKRPGHDKAELLQRTRKIVADLRMLASQSRALGYDVEQLEKDIARTELEVAAAIDIFMSNRYQARFTEDAYQRSRARRLGEFDSRPIGAVNL